jgi:hypothetical protein
VCAHACEPSTVHNCRPWFVVGSLHPHPHRVLLAQCPQPPCNPYGASALLHCLVAYLHTVVGAHVQKFKQLQEEDSEEEKWD